MIYGYFNKINDNIGINLLIICIKIFISIIILQLFSGIYIKIKKFQYIKYIIKHDNSIMIHEEGVFINNKKYDIIK